MSEIYIVFLHCKTMHEIIGVYSSSERSQEKISELQKTLGCTGSSGVIISAIKRVLDD